MPVGAFLAGILVAGFGQFGADWATDIRRGVTAPEQPEGCDRPIEAPLTGEPFLGVLMRVSGQDCWERSANIGEGDRFDVELHYANHTNSQARNVVVFAYLPEGVEPVAGTTMLHNANGTRKVADGINEGGLNIGGYRPGGDAYLKFTAIVTQDFKRVCGTGLVNVSTSLIGVAGWGGFVTGSAVTETAC